MHHKIYYDRKIFNLLYHIFFLLEGHDPEAPWAKTEPGRTAAQEEARPSAERTEHRPTQRPTQPQQPPAPALRPGEQPSPGPYTQQEEETPAEETQTCEFYFSSLHVSKNHDCDLFKQEPGALMYLADFDGRL